MVETDDDDEDNDDDVIDDDNDGNDDSEIVEGIDKICWKRVSFLNRKNGAGWQSDKRHSAEWQLVYTVNYVHCCYNGLATIQ